MEHKKDMQAPKYCPVLGRLVQPGKNKVCSSRHETCPCAGKSGICDNIYTGCGIV